MFRKFKWSEQSEKRIKLTLSYEPVQTYLFVNFLKCINASIAIDVGANIGQYTILASSVSSVNKIYAFEAETVAHDQIKANIDLNKVSNIVRSFPIAISDIEGNVQFGVRNAMAGNNGIVDTTIHDKEIYKTVRSVNCSPLDAVVLEHAHSIGIKIDVEGHELAVIAGANKVLTCNKCFVQVESYENEAVITSVFKTLGYRRILKSGPDLYFTNALWIKKSVVLEVIERSFQDLIDYNLNKTS